MGLEEVVILGMCRMPIGDFMGSLKDTRAKSGDRPEIIDEICMGQVYDAM